jgi:hypothetical protein
MLCGWGGVIEESSGLGGGAVEESGVIEERKQGIALAYSPIPLCFICKKLQIQTANRNTKYMPDRSDGLGTHTHTEDK